MEYLIMLAIFIGGNVTGAWHEKSTAARQEAKLPGYEMEIMELNQRLQDPACDMVCRERAWKRRVKVEKKVAKIMLRRNTKGSKALAMTVDTK